MTYQRKTADEWHVQGHYVHGWETIAVEETRQAARYQLKCYDENEAYPHRIVKKRVRKEL